MSILNNEQLNEINGGTSINGTIINAFINGINEIINAGRLCGSAIRRIFEGTFCNLE